MKTCGVAVSRVSSRDFSHGIMEPVTRSLLFSSSDVCLCMCLQSKSPLVYSEVYGKR